MISLPTPASRWADLVESRAAGVKQDLVKVLLYSRRNTEFVSGPFVEWVHVGTVNHLFSRHWKVDAENDYTELPDFGVTGWLLFVKIVGRYAEYNEAAFKLAFP